MPLRLMQIVLPERARGEIDRLLEDRKVLGSWPDGRSERLLVQLLVPAEECEELMDKLQERFSSTPEFQVVLSAPEAVLPRPEPEPAEPETISTSPEPPEPKLHRIGREEPYRAVTEGIGSPRLFLAMAALSSVVAAVGLLRNDLAVIIGAMVIAPLLGPNVALSLATTLGDTDLARQALRANLMGLTVAVTLSVAVGWLLPVDPSLPAIFHRTQVGPADIVLALAAGAAGTLALTTGFPGALIGVMVAVALLPPLVTFGMLLGAGKLSLGADGDRVSKVRAI
jgi:uncharacterized hydrophobic protein (TIGR00341 family)